MRVLNIFKEFFDSNSSLFKYPFERALSQLVMHRDYCEP